MHDLLREERIDGKRVYDGRILVVEVDQVLLEDGRQVVREVVRHPGAVVIVPVQTDGHILFERQFRYPVGEVVLELPAGKLDSGEDPLLCAQRELTEETGSIAAKWRNLGSFYTAPGFSDEVMHAFLAEEVRKIGDQNLDEDERIELVSIPKNTINALIQTGKLRDGKSIVALTLAGMMEQE